MNEQGPVIDAVKQLLANIWGVLKALAEFLATVPERIEARVASLETKLLIGFAILVGLVVLHGWITRPRK